MANLACYPAINLPNGFSETGSPTNMTIFAQQYREMEILALAKAFQDIIRGVVSCDLKLDGQVDPADAQTGIVTLDGTDLTFGTDWNLDKDGVTIHLLGKACDSLKMAANPKVDAVFACGAVIL